MNVNDLNKHQSVIEYYKKLSKDAPWPYNLDIQKLASIGEELIAELKRTVTGRAVQDFWEATKMPGERTGLTKEDMDKMLDTMEIPNRNK